MHKLIHWLFSALAIIIAAYLLPGVSVSSFFTALVVAVVLGLLNMFIRPLLIILSLPLQILTLGLFTFIINAFIIMLTSYLIDGFRVTGFGSALLFSIVLFFVNLIFHHWDKKAEK